MENKNRGVWSYITALIYKISPSFQGAHQSIARMVVHVWKEYLACHASVQQVLKAADVKQVRNDSHLFLSYWSINISLEFGEKDYVMYVSWLKAKYSEKAPTWTQI